MKLTSNLYLGIVYQAQWYERFVVFMAVYPYTYVLFLLKCFGQRAIFEVYLLSVVIRTRNNY